VHLEVDLNEPVTSTSVGALAFPNDNTLAKKVETHLENSTGGMAVDDVIKDQEKLEKLVSQWILDPSSFIGPNGDINDLYFQKEQQIQISLLTILPAFE